jgi:ribosomal protein S12 methylthiotransferase
MKKAALISLGCAKNLVDSESMVKQLLESGYEMSDAPAEAELLLVNTCGFHESAVREAIETILENGLKEPFAPRGLKK